MPQIKPIDIVAPGAFGLNTEKGALLLRPEWATVALNMVINRAGRASSRLGWNDQTTNPISGTKQIDVLHEYLTEAGVSQIITCADNKIYKDIDDYTDAGNDITEAAPASGDHWQFINFDGFCLGFQRGETPIARTSSDFADVSYTGTGPDGNCAVAAFGRVWAADADLQTVRISALLDHTKHDVAGGDGSATIDMSSVWTNGMDEIVAIAAMGGTLIVFGKNHIVLWADGSGSEIGLSPARMQVVDTIEGTGCIARDSIQATGEGDLIFLSRHGIQSLGRVIQSKSNPTVSLTKNVRSMILSAIDTQRTADSEFDQVRSTHSPEEGLYIINFPASDKQIVLDTRHPFIDDEGDKVFPVTEWKLGGTIGALLTTVGGKLYFGSAGVVGRYQLQNDNGSHYDFGFETGWLDFEELNHNIKMLKELLASVVIGNGTINYTWEFDFSGTKLSRQIVYTNAAQSEYNVAEYNLDEYAGGAVVQRRSIPAYGEGQFLKLGVTVQVKDFAVAVQHMSIAPKIGRLVT
ncbi:hypothetical protein LCGC14_0900400 [marine sediment metagenome]|uniref:Uncharacterized protein n=1 Tax=marine sediment metagenome TaxID=412755 RepID=A0A0F9S3I9_9ZZZZ